jgi:hypothetical protein
MSLIASAGTTWSSSGRCWTRCVWSRCVWSRCYWRSPTNALSLITSAKTAGASAGRKRLLRQRCARQQGNRENGRERAHSTSYLADQQHTPNHFNSPVKTLGHSKSFRADRVALRVYPSLAESIASFLSVQPLWCSISTALVEDNLDHVILDSCRDQPSDQVASTHAAKLCF